jgi:hypothetical protein
MESGQTQAVTAAAAAVWRVKLYVLNDEGEWVDKGTGSVSLKMKNRPPNTDGWKEAGTRVMLQVVTESQNQETILYTAVSPHFNYERQGDNIITWKDKIPVLCGADISKEELEKWSEFGEVDIALSFQEIEGQKDMWNRICAAQGHYSSDFVGGGGKPKRPQAQDVEAFQGLDAQGPLRGAMPATEVQLPKCEIGNLADIRKLLTETISFEKAATAKVLQRYDIDKCSAPLG